MSNSKMTPGLVEYYHHRHNCWDLLATAFQQEGMDPRSCEMIRDDVEGKLADDQIPAFTSRGVVPLRRGR